MRKTSEFSFILFFAAFFGVLYQASGQYTLADTTLALKYIKDGDSYLNKGKPDSAMIVTELALTICKSVYSTDNMLLAKALATKGKTLGYMRNTREAMACFDQASAICDKLNPEDPLAGQILMGRGLSLARVREFHESLRFLEKAKDFSLPRWGEKNNKMLAIFSNLATGYYNIGNYKKAILYNLKSIGVLEAHPEIPRSSAALIYTNTGVVYRNLGDYTNAVKYSLKGLEIYQKIGTPVDIAISYNAIGNTILSSGDYNTALVYLEKAKQLIEDTHPELVQYNFLGYIYTAQKDYDKAENILKTNLALSTLKPKDVPIKNKAGAYYALGRVFYEKGDFATAESNFIKALDLLTNLDIAYDDSKFQYNNVCGLTAIRQHDFEKANRFFEQSELYFNNSKQFSNGLNFDFPDLLQNKGLMYKNWYKQTQNTGYLYDAMTNLQRFDQTLDLYYGKIEFARNLRTLSGSYKPGYETAIETALLLQSVTDSVNYQNKAFTYAEKTKFMQLRQGNQEFLALNFGGIPPQVLEKENDLRTDITYFEKQRFAFEQNGGLSSDSNFLVLNTRITDLTQQYESLKRGFEVNYPNYYRLKYDQQVIDVNAVQHDLLGANEALVSYFVSDSSIFIFCVKSNDYRVVQVKKDFPLADWVSQMRSGMTDYFVNPAMANQYSRLSEDYATAASKLYDKLIAPVAAMLPEKVVIIPDGILGYIPFEALLAEKPTDPTRWNQHHYFQNDHAVSYSYSATMLREMKNRKHLHQPEIPFLGYAPKYDGDTTVLATSFQFVDNMRKDLKPLPNSGEEVYRAARILKGQSFVGAAATEEQFVATAGNGRIIHLATHGQANDKNGDFCFMVFSEIKDSLENEMLYAREIYNLQINADLVTLSACETGIGELQNGEGMISLARAFSYAGAKSVVTSLWSVSDGKTKDLMLDFYKNLHSKMPKDAALREAKLTFLKNRKGLAAHPYYWAGFIGIGDMGVIPLN